MSDEYGRTEPFPGCLSVDDLEPHRAYQVREELTPYNMLSPYRYLLLLLWPYRGLDDVRYVVVLWGGVSDDGTLTEGIFNNQFGRQCSLPEVVPLCELGLEPLGGGSITPNGGWSELANGDLLRGRFWPSSQ